MTQITRAGGPSAVQPVSLVDRAAEEIRLAILNGDLPPGEPISIAHLSTQLEVSHVPVREALRRLATEGLVTLRPGRSAVVTPTDLDDLHEIYKIRRLLEVAFAIDAAPDYDESDRRAIRECYDALSLPRLDAAEAYRIHHEFHLAILRPAISDWGMRILETLWNGSERYVRLVLSQVGEQPDAAQARSGAHKEIYEAAISGSSAELADAVSRHLDTSERLIVEGIQAQRGT